MKRICLALWFLIFANAFALAQSNPGLAPGQVPTATQWNSYFSAKNDLLGFVPLSTLGGTMLGKLNTFASAAGGAGLNIPQGAAPSSPVNGDIWATSSGVYAQIAGSTVGPFGSGVVGTLAVTSGGTGGTTWTTGLPLIGAGTSALTQGTVTGNTTEFATFTGAATSGNCVSISAAGNLQAAGGACTTGGGGGTVSAATIGQVAIYVTSTTTVGGLTTCNNGYVGTNGSGVNSCSTSMNTTLSATITALGTIASGTWQGTTIGSTYGGTGVNNGASTITIGGSVTFSGAYTFTGTLTGITSVTFPTAGTLMNQTGTSGGIPYYSSSTTVVSSLALTANLPVFGGGAGTAPFVGTRSGNTTEVVTTTGSQTFGNCVSIDANGNHVAASASCGVGIGAVLLNTLTASNSATIQDTTSFTSAYKFYDLVFLNIIPATNGTHCELQVQASSAFQTNGYMGNAALSAVSTYIPCSEITGNVISTNNGISGIITVFNPSNASIAAMFNGVVTFIASGPQSASVAVGGQWNTAAAVTGFQVFMATGNITSGEIYVYGRN
jgi:hypothetical protein